MAQLNQTYAGITDVYLTCPHRKSTSRQRADCDNVTMRHVCLLSGVCTGLATLRIQDRRTYVRFTAVLLDATASCLHRQSAQHIFTAWRSKSHDMLYISNTYIQSWIQIHYKIFQLAKCAGECEFVYMYSTLVHLHCNHAWCVSRAIQQRRCMTSQRMWASPVSALSGCLCSLLINQRYVMLTSQSVHLKRLRYYLTVAWKSKNVLKIHQQKRYVPSCTMYKQWV